MHTLECTISDNCRSVSLAQYITKHHAKLPGDAEIVTNFTVEVHKALGVKQIKWSIILA